jgi:hypothetical protein
MAGTVLRATRDTIRRSEHSHKGVAMNRLLAEAFAEVSKLPESEQEAPAAWVLDELAAERRWDQAFADTPDALAQLADEALTEHRQLLVQRRPDSG